MPQMIPAWVDGTLSPVEKLQVHREGLRHQAVSVFVMSGARVLVQRRALGKYHTPGLWANTCCTHPEWGEDSLTCAQRRLHQELGIQGLLPEFRRQLEYRAEVGQGLIEHEVVDLFVAQASEDLALSPDPSEVMDTAWIALPELVRDVADHPEHYTPWLRIYLRDYRDELAR